LKPKEYYTGMGMVLGVGIGGVLAILTHLSTGNIAFVSFVALGGAVGLLVGQVKASVSPQLRNVRF